MIAIAPTLISASLIGCVFRTYFVVFASPSGEAKELGFSCCFATLTAISADQYSS